MADSDRCPTCSCETNGEHTCPRTKAPTTREMAERLTTIGRSVLALSSVVGEHASRLEALERAKENTEHGGGLDRNATPREGRCPTPAASALPERPVVLEWNDRMTTGTFAHYVGAGRAWQTYALSLESRLAEANESIGVRDRNVDTLVADIASLKAKLAEALGDFNKLAHAVCKAAGDEIADLDVDDPQFQEQSDPWEACRAITKDRDALRAKLDGVREALSDAISTVGGARRSCVGDHYIYSPQVRTDQVDRWRFALAAPENTNTGDAHGSVSLHDVPSRDRADEAPRPAVSHPSPATAFEMTESQWFRLCQPIDRKDWGGLKSDIESLVRSELRKAREGQS